MVDPVFTAEPIEEHVDRGPGVLASEHLAVVGEDLLWHAMHPQGGQEAIADQLRAFPRHRCRQTVMSRCRAAVAALISLA